MKLLVFRALSQNNVMTEMSASLAGALNGLGVETVLAPLPIGEPGWPNHLVRLLTEGKYDHAVSFGSFSADLVAQDGRSVYDILGCGFVGWDVDHPTYQFRRFATSIGRRMQVCASNAHFEFERAMGCRTQALPLLPGVDAVADAPLPLDQRPYHVVAAMSWLGEPERWWDEAKGTPAYSLIEGVVQRMLADPQANLFRAFEATVADTGIGVGLDENVCSLLAHVGYYIRRLDRMRTVETIANLDVPRAIIGAGWRERLGERPHLTYLDAQDFGSIDALYGQARVVLNLNGANGASERAMVAMAAGAAVASDYGELLDLELQAKGALRFFDRRDPSTIAEALGAGDLQTMADRGRSLVGEEHLWPHKAARLVEALRGPT